MPDLFIISKKTLTPIEYSDRADVPSETRMTQPMLRGRRVTARN